jgi:hypothetical protein
VSVAVLIDTPWARVKHPTPIPAAMRGAELMELDDVEFAQLIRDQLIPHQPTGPEREAWGLLWTTFGNSEPELAERVFDVLEELLEQTEEALRAGQLDDAQTKRARKFTRFCEEAWNRLEVTVHQPLGWAGRAAASGFNRESRIVIGQLVEAIATHRETRETTTQKVPIAAADKALWAVLRTVGLDPDTYPGAGSG